MEGDLPEAIPNFAGDCLPLCGTRRRQARGSHSVPLGNDIEVYAFEQAIIY